MKDCVSPLHTGRRTPNAVGIILGDSNICEPEEGRFYVWNPTFTDGDAGKTAMCHSFFPHVLEIAQPDYTRRNSTALGVKGTLSRIDRIFINLPMAEAPEPGEPDHSERSRSSTSCHSKANKSGTAAQTHSQLDVQTSRFLLPFCNDLTKDHCFSTDPFGALTEFKVLLEKAKRLTIRELSRKTPDSSGAKLFIACTALRAYRNRHLGTLMRCCEGWKPIENCFEPTSFECVDFQRLCQIIANLARENLAEREAEITNLP